MNRKRLSLLILFLLLLLALLYAFWQTPRQRKADSSEGGKSSTPAATKQTAATERGITEIPRLRDDLLERKPEAYAGVKRNLFYATRRGGETTKLPVIIEPPPPPVPEPIPQPPPVPPPTPQQLAAQELARFSFLGFLKKGEEKTVFLASEGEIFLVHKGDRFGRKREFFVTDVTPARLVIRQEEVGEIIVPLVDKESLKPASFSGPANPVAPSGTVSPYPFPGRNWGGRNGAMPAPGSEPIPVQVEIPDENQPNEAENEN